MPQSTVQSFPSPKAMLNRLKEKFRRRDQSSVSSQVPSQRKIGQIYADVSSEHLSPGISQDTPPPYSTVDTSPTAPPLSALDHSTPCTSGLGSTTSSEDKYAFLSTFDTVFVIDDSESMTSRSWREVRDVLGTITSICTSYDPDGVDIYFLNHRSWSSDSSTQASCGYTNIRDASQVQRLFGSVRPCGATPTGAQLDSILKPYVAHLADHPGNMDDTKPLNIIVITDGGPTDDPEGIIVHYAKKLDQIGAPPH
ncbi:hypothetical protein MRS44_018187 [Fusarium solani]|uniref:uncharacterized protein n=1 Tax=Fusarium solani TaxID=169388 RepID=UPI0032C47BEE|nr:hypothetical protein MRS44_018187 [Fusarium solani]